MPDNKEALSIPKLWECTSCGHIWPSRKDKPHVCPECHKYLYIREYQHDDGKRDTGDS